MDEDFRLETERLRLRPYRLVDLDDLHAMFSDPEHMRWYPAPFDRETTRAWLDRQIAGYRDRGYALWIVEDRATDAFLGTAGPVLLLVEEAEEVEIGWHTRPGRKGEGIAPEAGAAARDWAFANLDLDHVISLVRTENLASVRVAEKIGMHVDREVDYKCGTTCTGSIGSRGLGETRQEHGDRALGSEVQLVRVGRAGGAGGGPRCRVPMRSSARSPVATHRRSTRRLRER